MTVKGTRLMFIIVACFYFPPLAAPGAAPLLELSHMKLDVQLLRALRLDRPASRDVEATVLRRLPLEQCASNVEGLDEADLVHGAARHLDDEFGAAVHVINVLLNLSPSCVELVVVKLAAG